MEIYQDGLKFGADVDKGILSGVFVSMCRNTRNKIKGNNKINGKRIGNIKHFISQFADDIFVFLYDTENSLETTLNLKKCQDYRLITLKVKLNGLEVKGIQ